MNQPLPNGVHINSSIGNDGKDDKDLKMGEGGLRIGCPWLEKYRPRDLQNVVHQREAISALKNSIKLRTLPNFLFHGPAGTGKTTTALALAKQLIIHPRDQVKNNQTEAKKDGLKKDGLKEDGWRDGVLEMNASMERGIDSIRDKVKKFVKFRCSANVAFKIVILDEADALTKDAQAALRRIMESSTGQGATRFFILCNNVTKIIDPIVSRCATFRFRPIPSPQIISNLQHILHVEKIKSPSTAILSLIARESQGDMRRAISDLFNVTLMSVDQEDEEIYDIISAIPHSFIQNLFLPLIKDEQVNGIKDEKVNGLARKVAQEIVFSAYSLNGILRGLCDIVSETDSLNDGKKAKIMICIAEAEEKLLIADPLLQLTHLFSQIQQITLLKV